MSYQRGKKKASQVDNSIWNVIVTCVWNVLVRNVRNVRTISRMSSHNRTECTIVPRGSQNSFVFLYDVYVVRLS